MHKKCVHNKIVYYCKRCKILCIGGTGICDHGNRKDRCKKCNILCIGGTGICDHGNRKDCCKKNKIDVCDHNKKKRYCVECNIYKKYIEKIELLNQLCIHSIIDCIDCKI